MEREAAHGAAMQPQNIYGEGADISKTGGAIRKNLKDAKVKNSGMPLVRIWEEGERRKVDEEKRLEGERKLQVLRGNQWYLPKELAPVKGDNFSVLRTLQEQAGWPTKETLDSRKAPDLIIPSAPSLPTDNTENASGNIVGLGQFQANAPPQTADDTQCSLPSYEEAINIT